MRAFRGCSSVYLSQCMCAAAGTDDMAGGGGAARRTKRARRKCCSAHACVLPYERVGVMQSMGQRRQQQQQRGAAVKTMRQRSLVRSFVAAGWNVIV